MAFSGFPPEAFEFYARLEADNSKVFWQDNKATFESAVKGPIVALGEELAEFGPFHVFRPYNDLRFAKNRPPYKTAQGAISEGEGGCGYYVQLSAEGMMAAAGYYMMAKDQLARFAAVDAEGTGAEIAALADGVEADGYDVAAHDELKTAPRGFAKGHPRISLLRRGGLMASRSWPVAPWMHTTQVPERVRVAWAGTAAMCAWLDAHVGPSTMPPDARRGRGG